METDLAPHEILPASSAGNDIPDGWRIHHLTVAGRKFELRGPARPDALLDLVTDQNEASTSPYWAALWPTATKLAEFVLQRNWPTARSALELGCGLGLVGIAGLSAGLHVTFSDLVPIAVTTARQNALTNGLVPADAIVLDWREPPRCSYSTVLGSDVLFDEDLQVPLLKTLDAVLAEDGECWLGDPGRSTADLFVERATRRGYAVEIWDVGGSSIPAPMVGNYMLIRVRRVVASGP
jgi:predicted nicotinamide N-methyase